MMTYNIPDPIWRSRVKRQETRDYAKQPPGYGRAQTAFGVVSIPIDYQAWVGALPILSSELSEQLLGVMDVE